MDLLPHLLEARGCQKRCRWELGRKTVWPHQRATETRTRVVQIAGTERHAEYKTKLCQA